MKEHSMVSLHSHDTKYCIHEDLCESTMVSAVLYEFKLGSCQDGSCNLYSSSPFLEISIKKIDLAYTCIGDDRWEDQPSTCLYDDQLIIRCARTRVFQCSAFNKSMQDNQKKGWPQLTITLDFNWSIWCFVHLIQSFMSNAHQWARTAWKEFESSLGKLQLSNQESRGSGIEGEIDPAEEACRVFDETDARTYQHIDFAGGNVQVISSFRHFRVQTLI